MKRTSLSFCMLLFALAIYGQAYEGTVAYQKSQQPAAIIELGFAPDMVRAAMNDHLSKKGKSKGNDLKGFTMYRNTGMLPGDSINADLFFKIERRSRQQKELSTVSLLLQGPGDQTAAAGNVHYLSMDEAKAYLNDLSPAIAAYNLEQVIKDQNDAVIKAESKYKSLVNEGEELEKKKAAIEKMISENTEDQQKQMNEVESQKQKLATWIGQRK